MRIRTFVESIAAPAVGFLYPPVCLLCRSPLPAAAALICAACRSAMRTAGPAHALCASARARLAAGGSAGGFTALLLFEPTGPVRDVLHLLKYRGLHALGVELGAWLGAAIAADEDFGRADLLVPVPLHPARLGERGYNQSERLCEGIRRVTGIPAAPRGLVRVRNTGSQTPLSAAERERNVAGAFLPGPPRGAVAGRRVLVVDDVFTTGATLAACGDALRSAGAACVLAAALAVADHRA